MGDERPDSMVGRTSGIVTAPCSRRTYGAAMEVSPEDPWAAYAQTVVEIRRPGAADIVVRSAPPGRWGAWPWASSAPVHILTAWDPGDERPGDQENRVRQAALEADLRHVGTRPVARRGCRPRVGPPGGGGGRPRRLRGGGPRARSPLPAGRHLRLDSRRVGHHGLQRGTARRTRMVRVTALTRATGRPRGCTVALPGHWWHILRMT